MLVSPEDIQRKYYTDHAHLYDSMHVDVDDEHCVALKYISSLLELLNISSVLDIGCGTGRAIEYFTERGVSVLGVEPVEAMIVQAIRKNGIAAEQIVCGAGECLPFDNDSFDAVCEFGVLHHVPHPNIVVGEMMRVARKAVFLSDGNRFGQGNMVVRLIKLLLYKMSLWSVADFIKTRGKRYSISEGDGLFYSYSVFDSFSLLAKWADKIILIPTRKEKATSWYHPLLTSSHILLCAFKEQ